MKSIWRKGALVCGTVVLAAVAIVLGRWTASQSSPIPQTHDFGTIPIYGGDQQPLSHEFKVVNHSLETRSIVNVFSTCGCIGAWFDGRRYDGTFEIPMFKGAVMPMRVELSGVKPGMNRESVTVVFSDGEREAYTLQAEGRLREAGRLILSQATSSENGFDLTGRIVVVWPDSKLPPTPTIMSAGEPMRAEIDEWVQIEPPDQAMMRSARYLANFRMVVDECDGAPIELLARIGDIETRPLLVRR